METFYVVPAEGVLLVTSEWRPGSVLTMHETAPPIQKKIQPKMSIIANIEKHWFRANI